MDPSTGPAEYGVELKIPDWTFRPLGQFELEWRLLTRSAVRVTAVDCQLTFDDVHHPEENEHRYPAMDVDYPSC